MTLQCAEGRTRTADTRIFSPVLYQLSYLGQTLSGLYAFVSPAKPGGDDGI